MLILLQDPPYMMLKADSAFLAGNDRFEGYLADILERLATSVGFEYEIRLSRDGKHGDLHMDRIWDGMMGDIQRGVSEQISMESRNFNRFCRLYSHQYTQKTYI